ncbi:protein kinase [Candidatus Uabimicrobium sp. HlEnr_7]|uniref:protein kinase domain-containing protein n=1 Tax=Candidatus Uabimicrobium helgolandensis TaxID=3095367 RepID=UPI0035569988
MYGEIVAIAETSSQYTVYPGDFLVFGRGKNADVILDDNAISRLHCKVFYHKSEFWIQDFGSRNSTLINNERVSRQPLKHGDVIRFGRHRFRFHLRDEHKKNYAEDQEESFSKLKRHDKLIGKIAVELGYIKRSEVKKCILLQETLSEDNDYIHLEDIFLQENCLSADEIQKINKYKIQVPSIEGYKLQELIGVGGMGRIYKGRFVDDPEPVAIKVLTNTNDENQMQLSHQFIREAKAIAKLNHKNIVAGLDFGFAGKNIYIVMEYIDGPNLQQHLKEQGGRLLPDETLNMVMQIASALEHAHSCGLVHRDIKTDNILLATPNSVKLCDFGLVRDVEETGIDDEKVFGTVAYMSPEQCLFKKNIDIRADIYSLGVVFFRMLYGDLPFKGTKKDVRRHHVQLPVKFPPSQSDEKQKLAEIIAKMMAKKPKDRYQNPSELLQDLNIISKDFSPVEDADGTAEVEIEYSVSLDDTETRMLKTPVETQEFSPWQLANFAEKVAHIKKYPTYYWKHVAVILITAALFLYIVFVYNISNKRQHYYDLAEQAINKQNFNKAGSLISNISAPDMIKKLQSHSMARIEIIASKNPHRALKLYNLISTWGNDSEITNMVNSLQKKLREKIELNKKDRSFWTKLQDLEKRIYENTDLAYNFQQLYALASTREHREAYQKLQENFARHQVKQQLKNYRFISQFELKFNIYHSPQKPFSNLNFHPLAAEKKESNNISSSGHFFVFDNPFLYRISSKNGSCTWVKKVECSLSSFEDIVFLSAGSQTSDFTKVDQFILCDYSTKTFYLIDAQSGQQVWNFQIHRQLSAKIACYDSKIYLPCIDKNTYIVDLESHKVFGCLVSSSKCVLPPVLNNDVIYLSCYDGKTYGFNLSKKSLQHYVKATNKPALFFLYIQNAAIHIVQSGSGFTVYQHQIQGFQSTLVKKYEGSRPILGVRVFKGNMYIKTDLRLYKLDPKSKQLEELTGTRFLLPNKNLLEKEMPEGKTFSQPQIAGESCFVQIKLSTGIWCAHFYKGKKVWEKRLSVAISNHKLHKNNAWLAANDGRLYCVRLSESGLKYRYIPGHKNREIKTSFTRLLGKKSKILTITNTKQVKLYDFAKAKRYKIAKINLSANNEASKARIFKGKYAFVANKNKLHVVSLKTGKNKYKPYLAPRNFATAPLFFRGYVFIALKDKHLYCLKLINKKSGPYMKSMWRFKSKRQINELVRVKEKLYLTDKSGYVYAVDMRKGRRVWYNATRGIINSPFLYHDNYLYACNSKGLVYKFSLSGRVIWKKELKGNFSLAPQTNGEYLYVTNKEGSLFKLDLQDGVMFRKTDYQDTPQIFFHHNKTVYIGSHKGFLYSLDE